MTPAQVLLLLTGEASLNGSKQRATTPATMADADDLAAFDGRL